MNNTPSFEAQATPDCLLHRLAWVPNSEPGVTVDFRPNGLTRRSAHAQESLQLEAENVQMHRIIARLTLKVDAMEDLIRKNGWGLHSGKKR